MYLSLTTIFDLILFYRIKSHFHDVFANENRCSDGQTSRKYLVDKIRIVLSNLSLLHGLHSLSFIHYLIVDLTLIIVIITVAVIQQRRFVRATHIQCVIAEWLQPAKSTHANYSFGRFFFGWTSKSIPCAQLHCLILAHPSQTILLSVIVDQLACFSN